MVEVEFGAGIDDVNEVIRDFFVFAQVFTSSDVHAAIYLTGIPGKDFRTCIDRTLTGIDPSQPVQFSCERDGVACLSRGGRPEYADQVNVFVFKALQDFLRVDCLRIREVCNHRVAVWIFYWHV